MKTMNSCENSNKKFVFFHIAKSRYEATLSFFETQMDLKKLLELAHSHYMPR